MGFFSEIIGATVKTVTLPVAVAKDVVNVVTDKEVDSTKKQVEDIGKDIEKAVGLE